MTPQSLIVLIQFLPIKQCCDLTKLDCTHSISFHPTMLRHHKVWLYSFHFFPSSNVMTSQSRQFYNYVQTFHNYKKCKALITNPRGRHRSSNFIFKNSVTMAEQLWQITGIYMGSYPKSGRTLNITNFRVYCKVICHFYCTSMLRMCKQLAFPCYKEGNN